MMNKKQIAGKKARELKKYKLSLKRSKPKGKARKIARKSAGKPPWM